MTRGGCRLLRRVLTAYRRPPSNSDTERSQHRASMPPPARRAADLIGDWACWLSCKGVPERSFWTARSGPPCRLRIGAAGCPGAGRVDGLCRASLADLERIPRASLNQRFSPDSRPGNRLLRLAVQGVGVRAQAEPSHRSASRLWVPLSPTAMQTRLAGQDTEFSCAVSPDGVALS